MKRQFGQNKIILLLGAGASCDAKIKNSYQMISEIKNELELEWSEFKDLYNYIESSHYHLERIKNIQLGDISFNIENLVGLLDTIIRIAKKEVEGYNFVGAWEKELTNVAGIDFSKAQKFKNEILKRLKEKWLSPPDFKQSSAYYKKIGDMGYNYPLKIFSLNYDMCVEQNLESDGKKLERGFTDKRIWDYRQYDDQRDESTEFYLYKLHGSLDWKRDEEDRLTYVDGVQTIDPLDMQIIFGVQNKLQSYDPFNFYFYEFRQACFDTELIIVSGYGFMDKHINDNLINAFKINPDRILLVNTLLNPEDNIESYKEKLSKKLSIKIENIVIENMVAKEFFEKKLNIEYFSTLFGEENEQEDDFPF